MMCNCRWCEGILSIIILLVTFWSGLFTATVNKWIVVIAALLLLLHSVFHHKCMCGMCMDGKMDMAKKKRK